MRYAEKQHPQNVAYRWGVLNLLEKLGRFEDLYAQARPYIEQQGASPELLIQAAGILFGST